MVTAKEQKSDANKPAYMPALEAAYGAPSQAGFGSAVFYEPILAGDDLAQAALAKYKYFAGDLWERFGAAAWMGQWKEVYIRQDQRQSMTSWPSCAASQTRTQRTRCR